jgi:hypothetical protein
MDAGTVNCRDGACAIPPAIVNVDVAEAAAETVAPVAVDGSINRYINI